ncbi:MAG TPA: NUDIX hydrolase [Polyangia bacterium]|nr:NUDIX hydrolase [Polyangia bacterium]
MATRGEYTYPYPRPMVSVDAVVLRRDPAGVLVLLIRRGKPPFQGRLSLPGGFVELDEDLPEAAARELLEEAGVAGVDLLQVGAFGRPDRDPRGRNISIAFAALVEGAAPPVRAGDDATEALWVPLTAARDLPSDHGEILAAACRVVGLEPPGVKPTD